MKKFKTCDEALEYVRTLSIDNVMKLAAELLTVEEVKTAPRITVTEEQFKEFFKIRGINEAGEKETRGRKRH